MNALTQRNRREAAFRADAAFAKPQVYEALERRGVQYAIRIPANESLQRDIAELLPRPVGRPSINRVQELSLSGGQLEEGPESGSQVEHHQGELFPRVASSSRI